MTKAVFNTLTDEQKKGRIIVTDEDLEEPKLSYTENGLSFVNCTYVSGGYAKFGNIVIVNIRVTCTSTSYFDINGLPASKGLNVSANALNMTDDNPTNLYSMVGVTGSCRTKGSLISGKQYSISATYLTD